MGKTKKINRRKRRNTRRKLKGGAGIKSIIPFLLLTSLKLKPTEGGIFSKTFSTIKKIGNAVIYEPLVEGTWSTPSQIQNILQTGLTQEEIKTLNNKIKVNQDKIDKAITIVKGPITIETKPINIRELIIKELEEYKQSPTEFTKPEDYKYINEIVGFESKLRSYLGSLANELGEPVGLSSEGIIVFTLYMKHKGEGQQTVNYNNVKAVLLYLNNEDKANHVITVNPSAVQSSPQEIPNTILPTETGSVNQTDNIEGWKVPEKKVPEKKDYEIDRETDALTKYFVPEDEKEINNNTKGGKTKRRNK
jgi:hypothetical protein